MGNASISGRSGNHSYPPANSNLREYFLPQYGGKVEVDKHRKMVSKTCIVSADEEPDFLSIVEQRMRLSHPNLGKYLGMQKLQTNEGFSWCGATSRVYRLSYELHTYSLFNEIQHYCKMHQMMPEPEVCRIFESVVSCLEYLHRAGTQHGDIKVSSIFLDGQKEVKLIDSFFLKEGKTSYEVVLQDPKSMSLLAPEQLELLRIKLSDSLQATERYEIFMVGLSMIEVTTIKEGMRCYNLDKMTINEEFFINSMNDIQYCRYSYELGNLIMNCVHKIPSQRPSYHQFLTAISAIRRRSHPAQ